MDFACHVFMNISEFALGNWSGTKICKLFGLLPCIQVEENRTRIGKIRLHLFTGVVCICKMDFKRTILLTGICCRQI